MQYGLELPNGGTCGQPHLLVEMAALAEEMGWDGVFLEDYIVHWSARDAPTYDPWITIAAMALHTQRIRLGTTVTPLSRRRPWKLARETVTLDHLSNGRLILSVGLGDMKDAGFAKVGEVTDVRHRSQRLDEALDVLMGLWSGQPFSYQGEHYNVGDVTFLPRPVQTPRIPIWVGGGWPRRGTLQRAARWDGIVPYKVTKNGNWADMTPADVRDLKASIARHRSIAASFDIVIGGRTRGSDPQEARSRLEPLEEAGATWWAEFTPGNPDALRTRIKQGPPRF